MILIDSEQTAEKLLTDLSASSHRREKFIAVDTEFVREELDVPALCLIQIATNSNVYVIDVLSVNIGFLSKIFADDALLKVFHSGRQDIEILQQNGLEIKNVYDTQLYEMVLSTNENVSYQFLVDKYLGKSIKKSCSMSNWLQRPLSKKQIKYSVGDVSYLREIYQHQKRKLEELGRTNWLEQEHMSLLSHVAPTDSLERSVRREYRGVLNKLLNWRNAKAEQKHVSPESLIKDSIIRSVCNKGMSFVQTLKTSRIAKDEDLSEFLNFAEGFIGYTIYKENFSKRAVMDTLKVLLDVKSDEFQVAPAIIATKDDLSDFVDGDESVKFLSGWRYDLYGKYAEQMLSGKIKIGIKDSRVFLYE